jgi:hypothetical protein
MALHTNPNFDEITRILTADPNLFPTVQNNVFRVRALPNLVTGPVIRRVAIWRGPGNEMYISWVVPNNASDARLETIPLPTGGPGELVYDA